MQLPTLDGIQDTLSVICFYFLTHLSKAVKYEPYTCQICKACGLLRQQRRITVQRYLQHSAVSVGLIFCFNNYKQGHRKLFSTLVSLMSTFRGSCHFFTIQLIITMSLLCHIDEQIDFVRCSHQPNLATVVEQYTSLPYFHAEC